MLESLISQLDTSRPFSFRTSKSALKTPVTLAPLNIISPDNLVPPLTFDQEAVTTVPVVGGGAVVVLSTVAALLSTSSAGALSESDPPLLTLSSSNRNLNLAFVLAGGVAETVT